MTDGFLVERQTGPLSTMSDPLVTRILLCRHGESTGNLRRAFLGRRDVELTQTGKSQAKALAERLALEAVDAVYSSPLRRALDTSMEVAGRFGLSVRTDERLVEQDFGFWDGLDFLESRLLDEGAFCRWQDGTGDVPPSGGESLFEVAERGAAFLADTLSAHGCGQTVVAVAHAGILQALICHMFKIPLRNFWPVRLEPCGFADIRVYAKGPVLARLVGAPDPASR